VRFPAGLNRSAAATIGMTFLNARHRLVLPGDRLPGRVNDLAATDPRLWRRTSRPFRRSAYQRCTAVSDVLYRSVPAGIDMISWSRPAPIRDAFEYNSAALIKSSFRKTAHSPCQHRGEVHQSQPLAYQEWAGARHAVEAAYVWRNGAIEIQTGPYKPD